MEELEKDKPQVESDEKFWEITELTNPHHLTNRRIEITKKLFPEDRKKEMLGSADKDKLGRPVRYFRFMTYKELKAILLSRDQELQDRIANDEFIKKSKEIKGSLKNFLEEEKIYEQFKNSFEALSLNFTLENYRKFIQCELPRIKLFELHISMYGGGGYLGITGLRSLSVGAPYQPPADPSEERGRDKEGLPVVEFSVPSDQVYVYPLFKSKTRNLEMEKEVNALILRPEWIADIYNGVQDFANRFIKDPQTVLYGEYQNQKKQGNILEFDDHDYINDTNVWDILQEWKQKESIADLIPKNKLGDIDENNPVLNEPLFK
jgi:hypothetical protein